MPRDRGLEEVSIVVRILFKPLGPPRPRAGVEKLDEDTGDRQGWMHGGNDSPELLQSGLPGAQLIIPQVDDAHCACIGNELVLPCTVMRLKQRKEVEDRATKGTKRGASGAQRLLEALAEEPVPRGLMSTLVGRMDPVRTVS